MNVRPNVLIVCAAALLPTAWSCTQSASGAGPTAARQELPVPVPQTTVELTGAGVARPTTFTFEQLARMKMTRLDNALMQMSHAPDERTSWRGPSLDALLAQAELKPGPMRFTLEAADGYRKTCLSEQLRGAIIALQYGDGHWLADTDPTCTLRLVPPDLTANYWIVNVRRISVEPLFTP